jgi:hypothetical protein
MYSLGYMMRQIGDDEAGEASHAAHSTRNARKSIECTVTVIQAKKGNLFDTVQMIKF